QALQHPNWSMGAKITIDSASMMNKGLEVIEAKLLFDLKMDQVEVVVHPQSIVHSCVQFQDGSIKAQMGLPDMKLPILYALGYPRRLANNFERFDFLNTPQLTFEKPDMDAFRNLALAFEVGHKGGNAPAILNAANEVAVARFLADEITFIQLTNVVEHALQNVNWVANPNLESLVQSDEEARIKAGEFRS
ncbi:MAG: 1-deoxy-D-xylulose-5-phosphate reductoisomerase, partial [Flavobacteriales bacterium]|nr:1-deoxy-D-xylulose-5-phosphate reductoisomerase [Flavobacteriales bacterium]